jgi:hypothetical protein
MCAVDEKASRFAARRNEAFLDVDRVGRVGERHAHLLRDRHEQVVEHFEQHRVGPGTDRVLAHEFRRALQDEVVACGERRAPPGLDHRGRILLGDDRRTGDPVARPQVGAQVKWRVAPGPVGEHAVGFRRRERPCARSERGPRIGHARGDADCLDRRSFDDQRLAGHQEAVLAAIAALEFGHQQGELCITTW